MTENDIKAHKACYGQMDSEYEEDGTGTRKGHGHDYGQTIMSQLNPYSYRHEQWIKICERSYVSTSQGPT
jgi:hypothetical protein